MQTRNEILNSGNDAGNLTTNPGNGSTLRIDVVKMFNWPAEGDEKRSPIMPNPETVSYRVQSDNMSFVSQCALFKNDELKAETIDFDHVLAGRTYIIFDRAGNVYLGNIDEIEAGKRIRLININPKYSDIYLYRNQIIKIAVVYRIDRPVPNIFDRDPNLNNPTV